MRKKRRQRQREYNQRMQNALTNASSTSESLESSSSSSSEYINANIKYKGEYIIYNQDEVMLDDKIGESQYHPPSDTASISPGSTNLDPDSSDIYDYNHLNNILDINCISSSSTDVIPNYTEPQINEDDNTTSTKRSRKTRSKVKSKSTEHDASSAEDSENGSHSESEAESESESNQDTLNKRTIPIESLNHRAFDLDEKAEEASSVLFDCIYTQTDNDTQYIYIYIQDEIKN